MKNQQVELDQRALIAGPDPHENFKRADYKKRNDQVKKKQRELTVKTTVMTN